MTKKKFKNITQNNGFINFYRFILLQKFDLLTKQMKFITVIFHFFLFFYQLHGSIEKESINLFLTFGNIVQISMFIFDPALFIMCFA